MRFRVCHLINKLLVSMGDEASIDDSLYDRIFECMLTRLRDRVSAIRCQAVLALVRLQEPNDDSCPVMKGYTVQFMTSMCRIWECCAVSRCFVLIIGTHGIDTAWHGLNKENHTYLCK